MEKGEIHRAYYVNIDDESESVMPPLCNTPDMHYYVTIMSCYASLILLHVVTIQSRFLFLSRV